MHGFLDEDYSSPGMEKEIFKRYIFGIKAKTPNIHRDKGDHLDDSSAILALRGCESDIS